jgi:cytochrome oxidase Cu insertion factor (SCO1/SenC/PrrC family)
MTSQMLNKFFNVVARKLCVVMFLLLSCCLIVSRANAQITQPAPAGDKAVSSKATGKLIKIDNTQVQLPDVKVFTQSGEQVNFYTDLIKDKVVLLSFFFSSCTYVCVMQGANLSKVQALLGERLGKDVFLISISMDPEKDTPQKLKYWSRSFGAKSGWTIVSSNTPEMNRMLKAFTGYNPGPKDMHMSLVFIGNDKTGAWMTTDGLTDPGDLATLIGRIAKGTDSK